MASELKPWRYEIKYGPDGEDNYSWVYDDHGAMVATMKTHKAKQIVDAMNTRPAPADLKAADRKHYKLIRKSLQNKGLLPAAADTGLETVGYVTPGWLAKHCSAHTISAQLTPAWTEAVVTRSQAEELLAEKDKTIALAETTMIEMHQDLNKLEADNAALTARIKELEKECDDFCADLNQERKSHESAHNRAEDLKAKLAAAEKSLERIAARDGIPLAGSFAAEIACAYLETKPS